jgi:hypothetical protein
MCNWLVVAGYVLLLAAVDIDSRALTPSSEDTDLVKGKQA